MGFCDEDGVGVVDINRAGEGLSGEDSIGDRNINRAVSLCAEHNGDDSCLKIRIRIDE